MNLGHYLMELVLFANPKRKFHVNSLPSLFLLLVSTYVHAPRN